MEELDEKYYRNGESNDPEVNLVARVAGDLFIPYGLRYSNDEEIRRYLERKYPEELEKAKKYLSLDEILIKAKKAKSTLRSMDA